MSAKKWGESFLKSGLPLEHLTQMTFRSLQWDCRAAFEYSRPNREGTETWFEVDLFAVSPVQNKSTGLAVLAECKYHDLSRSWFFLPHVGAGRWEFDDRVLNCGPYQTLRQPRANSFLELAPMSNAGIVVADDGTKQDNAVHTAIQQLVNAYVPCALDHMFAYSIDFRNVRRRADEATYVPSVTALVPMVVTNAALYRLKPSVTDLDTIRQAAQPTDIADLVPWTWYYHDVPIPLGDQNFQAMEEHRRNNAELIDRFSGVEAALYGFRNRPNWVVVANIRSLAEALTQLSDTFAGLQTVKVQSLIQGARSGRRARKR